MKTLFWHRRDLRIEDNKGLYSALKDSEEVQPVFIFDTNILDRLPKNDQRILFICYYINILQKFYWERGSSLLILEGNPEDILPKLCKKHGFNKVYTNRDYEPYAQQRDRNVKAALDAIQVEFKGFKDHVVFEKNEVTKDDQTPYTVFTPYSKKWKHTFSFQKNAINYDCSTFLQKLSKKEFTDNLKLFCPSSIGFKKSQYHEFPENKLENVILHGYAEKRNFPAINGTSKLSVHLRFGTISIRELLRRSWGKSESYLNELIWRDFYQMIIYHFPHSAKNSFKKKYDHIQWEKDEAVFHKWCKGETGYPLVDAGMRELNQTGFMHNRVRMVVSSFLTKHLLIDWRWGEAYFAEKLLDFELASNVGGWQWASGSGCDAAPYFRVFNPTTQQEKFDKHFVYIKKWVPEFGTPDYPAPVVEHTFARNRAINRYKQALSET